MTNPYGYSTIYNRLVNCAVSMLNEHHACTVEKAINKATEQSKLFGVYYANLKPAERAEMERLVIARRNEQAEDWQTR